MFGGSIGVPELLIVLVIALIVLGPKKLPEVGRSLGRGMREFKDSVSGVTQDEDDDEVRAIQTSTEARPAAVAASEPTAPAPSESTPQ
jgi:sec-independent protein translocase protein TatA